MSTPEETKVANTYCRILHEAKARTDAIDHALAGRTGLVAKLAEEFCYLQLRLICELIASGCLILHGNLKPKADLFRTYKADWLISELQKLHPKFFPVAVKPAALKPDQLHDLEEKESDFITREDVQTLWREAGGKLHRGGAKSILKPKPAPFPALDLPKVSRWRNRLVELLESHMVMTHDEENFFLFSMSANEIHWRTMSRVRDEAEIVRLEKLHGRTLRRPPPR